MTNLPLPRYKAKFRTVTTTARALTTSGVLAAALLASSAAQAGLNFNFTFSNDADAPVTTLEQQQAIITSGQLFSTVFGTYFTNSATLSFNVVSQSSGVASASSDSMIDGNGYLTEVVQTKVQGGGDLNGAAADGSIQINWSNNWVLNPNTPVNFGANELDLFSVINHEMTHALGFASITGLSGGGLQGKFDKFLTSLSGAPIIKADGTIDSAAYADAALNNALFTGANALAANGGLGVSIQGQDGDATTFSGALSHLGTIAFSAPDGGSPNDNALMLCCGGRFVTGQGRDYNAADVGILTDLGYTRVSAVPEPGSIALMMAGLAFVGYATKRRNS